MFLPEPRKKIAVNSAKASTAITSPSAEALDNNCSASEGALERKYA